MNHINDLLKNIEELMLDNPQQNILTVWGTCLDMNELNVSRIGIRMFLNSKGFLVLYTLLETDRTTKRIGMMYAQLFKMFQSKDDFCKWMKTDTTFAEFENSVNDAADAITNMQYQSYVCKNPQRTGYVFANVVEWKDNKYIPYVYNNHLWTDRKLDNFPIENKFYGNMSFPHLPNVLVKKKCAVEVRYGDSFNHIFYESEDVRKIVNIPGETKLDIETIGHRDNLQGREKRLIDYCEVHLFDVAYLYGNPYHRYIFPDSSDSIKSYGFKFLDIDRQKFGAWHFLEIKETKNDPYAIIYCLRDRWEKIFAWTYEEIMYDYLHKDYCYGEISVMQYFYQQVMKFKHNEGKGHNSGYEVWFAKNEIKLDEPIDINYRKTFETLTEAQEYIYNYCVKYNISKRLCMCMKASI